MRIAVPIPKKRLSSCRPVTLTVFESILYATASRSSTQIRFLSK